MCGCILFIFPAVYIMALPNLKTLLFLILENFSHYLTLLDLFPHSLYFSSEILVRHILILLSLQVNFSFIYYHLSLCFHTRKFPQFYLSFCNFFGYVSLIFNPLLSFPYSCLIPLRISRISICKDIFRFFSLCFFSWNKNSSIFLVSLIS